MGGNILHKFKEECESIILSYYPIDMDKRFEVMKKVAEEYKAALRK